VGRVAIEEVDGVIDHDVWIECFPVIEVGGDFQPVTLAIRTVEAAVERAVRQTNRARRGIVVIDDDRARCAPAADVVEGCVLEAEDDRFNPLDAPVINGRDDDSSTRRPAG